MDAVVGRARLFAQHRDLGPAQPGFGQAFEEFVANHAMTNDDDIHICSCDGEDMPCQPGLTAAKRKPDPRARLESTRIAKPVGLEPAGATRKDRNLAGIRRR